MAKLADRPATRAAIYPRVSDQAAKDAEERGQQTSLDTQTAACQRHAAERGYVVAPDHVFTEKHTGVELWERPQLARLRELVRAGAIDVVVAYAIDRLSRDPVHLGVILSEAEHHGVVVEFVTEPLDDSPEGQLIRFVKGYAAKVEHEKIKERTMRGKLARLRAGKLLPGNKAKYGYRFNAARTGYEVDPDTAPVAVRIKNEALQGLPLRRICARLMEEGIPTPGGAASGVWLVGTVRNILTDPAYTGRAAGMRKTYWKERGKVKVRVRGAEEQVALPAGVVPPLFTVDEQAAVVARLEANKRLAARNNRAPEEALLRGGFVRCGLCGTSMTVTPRVATRIPQYQCGNRNGLGIACRRQSIAVQKVDAAVWSRVSPMLARPEVVAREIDRLEESDDGGADVSVVERLLAGVDRQMRTLVEQLSGLPVGGAVAKLVLEKLASLEQQKGALDVERAKVQARAADQTSVRARIGDLTAWCRRFAAQLGETTYARRREAVYMLGVVVTVWPTDHPDRPADVDRFVIEASIPLEEPAEGAVVYRSSRRARHNTLALRWTDRRDATERLRAPESSNR